MTTFNRTTKITLPGDRASNTTTCLCLIISFLKLVKLGTWKTDQSQFSLLSALSQV